MRSLSPEVIVESKKKIHGWYPGRRECTGERLLLNPYNGCSNDCFCCYAKALPGHFQRFRKEGTVTVFRDFDRSVAHQLDSLNVVSCGYLSPVADPFQKIERRYGYSQGIVQAFVERNIPIEFVTKCRVPDFILELMVRQTHSFGQFSFFTCREEVRRLLMKEGATTSELMNEMERCTRAGLPVVCRIDPIIPFLTDGEEDLRSLVEGARDAGVFHVVASVMDIPLSLRKDVVAHLERLGHGCLDDFVSLYRERIGNSLHASIDYRRGIFGKLKEMCERAHLGFALCMEYKLVHGVPVGLNAEFMTTENCEGVAVPVYVRRGEKFEPGADCNGACLTCVRADCGIEELAMGTRKDTKKAFTFSDYRRWSRQFGEG